MTRRALRFFRALAVSATTLALVSACDRAPALPPIPASRTSAELLSPRQTIEKIVELRGTGSLAALAPLLISERAAPVLETLAALDEFLLANRQLCDHVRERVTPGLALLIDQSHMGDALDVFSTHVKVLGEQVDGDRATVSFLVNARLPVEHATLRRVDGSWRYDPGEGYDPSLPRAFRTMAEGVRRVLDDLRSGRLAPDALRTDPQRLLDEMRVRLAPGVKLLSRAQPATEGVETQETP